MRYRAVAVPSERSNAVGTVELECTPHGLFVAYLGVGAFSQGYAPGALASGTGVTAPWSQVTEARVEGEQLFIAFDERLAPLNRLELTHFGTGRGLPPEELAKRRLLVRLASAAAALVTAFILGAWVMRSSAEASAGAAVGLSLLAASALLVAGFAIDKNLASSGDEHAALAGFAMELGHYLPLLLHLPRPTKPPQKPLEIADFQGILPRTTLAIVITITAGLLSVLLVARWVSTNQGAVERVTERVLSAPPAQARATAPRSVAAPSPAAVASAATAAPMASSTDGVTLSGECRCERPDSPLWSAPLPRLSVLVLSQHVRLGKNPDESKRKKYLELDVAVVNNSSHELAEVALMVLFYDRDPPPSNRRTQVSNRSLFFEGPLLPGQAIKWSVEAEGTEFEIQNPLSGDIGPNGEDAAPTNRLAELLSARNRPVRLHGAMLLTFLGDPRAKEGVLSLREALRDDEAPFLTRLLQALGDVRVCNLRVAESGSRRAVSACVHNTTKQPLRELGFKLRALEHAPQPDTPLADPPSVLSESAVHIPGELAANSGRGLRYEADLGSVTPEAFEAYVDRYDLLR